MYQSVRNFEDYMKREILNLVTHQKGQKESARISRINSITKDTPYVASLNKSDNTYWKVHSRQRPKMSSALNKDSSCKTNAAGKGLVRSKSAFYRHLLKAEKTLNQKPLTQRKAFKQDNRKDTQATNSTHRRQILDSHMEVKRIQNLIALQLVKRQSSTISDNYLKAKLDHKKQGQLSNFQGLKVIKI